MPESLSGGVLKPGEPARGAAELAAEPSAPVDAELGMRPLAPARAAMADILLRPGSTEQVNQRNLVYDAAGIGLTEGIAVFVPVFLVRLGASAFQVGLFSALPALAGMLLAIPVGQFLSSRQGALVPIVARSRALFNAFYPLAALVPFVLATHQVEAVLFLWAFATIPQILVAVAINVVVGQIIRPEERFTVLGRRWAMAGLTTALAAAGAGPFLNSIPFPLNYQLLLLVVPIGAVVSYAFTVRFILPSNAVMPARKSLRKLFFEERRDLIANRPFVNFLLAQFVCRSGVTFVLPLLPLYWVRGVDASDSIIGAINGAQLAATMAAYFGWTRILQQRSRRSVLLAATFGVSLYPLLTAFTQQAALLVVWAGVGGAFMAAIDLVLFDILYRTIPRDQQPLYVGVYQTAFNLAAFLPPIAATMLANVLGLVPALVAGAILRLSGFGLVALLGVGQEVDYD